MNACTLGVTLIVTGLVIWIWWPMGLCLWLEYIAQPPPTKTYPYDNPHDERYYLLLALKEAIRRHPDLAPTIKLITTLDLTPATEVDHKGQTTGYSAILAAVTGAQAPTKKRAKAAGKAKAAPEPEPYWEASVPIRNARRKKA